ncbi:hypothetical protein CXF85_09755 [Colwellia sp. 75C3]|uniref:hypothetical protein n=1 Tax=Colwellia sp. 75C3 TaxID=888425 RepID=UPI000C331186|nr:hypothetical protein [Colwellia sp. 75C3]PKG83780.1 hypothetical protein CXF85_09755 [Colwellia sp. 75C3]
MPGNADGSVGRKTCQLAVGIELNNQVYTLFMLTSNSLILLYLLMAILETLSLIALIHLPLSIFTGWRFQT